MGTAARVRLGVVKFEGCAGTAADAAFIHEGALRAVALPDAAAEGGWQVT